ncbi:uncharacterized protein [Ptychodera flava]|uniref:uncharacterized protein isoform X3 n=1 Tax=Ptychodera flava TaxID=63121 RepID=UPI00396A5330
MPRAFLVKKKKQRVESIVEELAKQEGLEAKLSSSDGESDKKSDDDSSDKTSLLIAEVFSLGERKRQAEATEDAGESKLRTLEDLIERRLRETLEDTECRSKRDSQGESESVSQNRRLLNFSVNGDSQRERRDHETIFPKEKSKPPPLLRASPRSAFERVVSPKYVTVSPQTLAQVGPPPPLESRGFQSEFYYRSDVPTIPRTLPQSSAYGLTISSPRYILTDPRKQPYCEPDGALNLSRRPSKSDSDVDDGSHEDDGRDRDSPSRGAEYITKKKYILERNGRPEVMPAIELINGSGPTHRSPRRLPHHANEISPLFSSHSKTPFPYSSIFAERPRPESFLYSKSHSPIERNGYGPFEGQPETFVGRPSYPIQEAPLNLHQSPKDQKTFLGDPAEAERQRGRLDYPSDINSNELGLPNVYSGAQADNNDIKVTVTCDEPGKLHPSKIKINDLTLEQVISVQNTMPMKRNGKTIARQPILGVEYIQNGTDLKLRDMMDKEGNKSLGSEDSNDTDLGDEKDSLSEGSVGVGEGEEGAFVNGPTMEGRSDDEKPSPNRKYVCDICGKGFSRSNTLVTHKRIHTRAMRRFRKYMTEEYHNASILMPAFAYRFTTLPAFKTQDLLRPTMLKVVYPHPYFQTLVRRFWKTKKNLRAQKMSTGIILFTAAMSFCEEVHLYGYWPFPEDPDGNPLYYHYFDKNAVMLPPKKLKTLHHNMPAEFKMYMDLHNKGAIKLHVGQCDV